MLTMETRLQGSYMGSSTQGQRLRFAVRARGRNQPSFGPIATDCSSNLERSVLRQGGRSLRIAFVGAGLAGLASAAAFSRSGHEVAVFERADELRASGLAINLWSNATSLL